MSTHDHIVFSGKQTRIVIADPHPAVIQGLCAYLEEKSEIEIVETVVGAGLLPVAITTHRPDVTVVGYALSEFRPGSAPDPQVREILYRSLLLSEQVGGKLLHQAFLAGYKGVFYKEDSLEDLIPAISSVHRGRRWYPSRDSQDLLAALLVPKGRPEEPETSVGALSVRQSCVVSLVKLGLTNAQISRMLEVSQATVAHELTHIYRTLGVQDRLDLLVMVADQRQDAHESLLNGRGDLTTSSLNGKKSTGTLLSFEDSGRS